ncbi:MAG: hypothetical protein ASUL_05591 [Candidatus Aramenus sulfurataquae]|jgi:ribonuclease BN (tRNA processing enzyme)|uniref:Beta-lactamase n=2 Tax=Candidatus Aramenus sulfurataquae TaxID=1326980 RepID=W7KJA6_9CREN|nr:MAG: hypothetical protein ASUL_05591 [Candidatus Aramenus sulfurataquae]MCL7343185.1 MBL fold metallo-hydrolase [Candidatus Aramenus sulfurataquae]
MKITFLGTGSGASFGSRRMKSSILVESKGTKVLFDLGTGANFKLEDIGKFDVDAIFVTHLHIDHVNGVFEHLVQRQVNGLPKVKVFSPPGFSRLLRDFKELGNDVDAEVVESPLPRSTIGDLQIYSVRACHKIYAVSYVIKGEGKKVLYSGDTSEPCKEILDEAKDADLIIHEASCLSGCEKFGHTAIPTAISLFSSERLVLTHIPAQKEKEIVEIVKDRVKLANDGMVIDV